MMSLLCRFIWIVQSLDKVVDMPVIVNDSDCKQWKCLKLHRRQRQWHVAPGFAGFAFCAAFSTIAGRCSFSAWSLTRPLRTTTWVMVQTVQFLDKVVAMPGFRQVQFLGKVVDTPVVFNDRGYGPDSAVLVKLLLCLLFLRQCSSWTRWR